MTIKLTGDAKITVDGVEHRAPMEIKGKMETTFEWRCICGWENRQLDREICVSCGKERTTEAVRRHFKLIPEPVKVSTRIG